MKKVLLCFLMSAMSAQTVLAQVARGEHPAPFAEGSSAPNEEERKREEERRQKERDRFEKAMNAEVRREVSAVGRDNYDCLRNAQARADSESYDLIRECERETEGLTTCEIAAQRTSEYPGPIRSVSGYGDYNERKSDEATCRSSSIYEAENNALTACRVKFGLTCDLTSRGVVTDYHTEKRRRYFLFGPRDLRQICKADASAEPPSHFTTQCSVETVVKARRIRPRY